MGEYVEYRGHQVKLGTCEDLYYARFSEIQQCVHAMKFVDGNMSPAAYMNRSSGWRYRFPYPDEDQVSLFCKGDRDFDRGLALPFVSVPGDDPWVCDRLTDLGQRYGRRHRDCDELQSIEIVQQKLVPEGQLWTVLRCSGCDHKYRIDANDAEILAKRLFQLGEEWREIALRMLSGYVGTYGN